MMFTVLLCRYLLDDRVSGLVPGGSSVISLAGIFHDNSRSVSSLCSCSPCLQHFFGLCNYDKIVKLRVTLAKAIQSRREGFVASWGLR